MSIVNNRKDTTVDVVFTGNNTIDVVGVASGNTEYVNSDIAIGDEIIGGATVQKVYCGGPTGGYWELRRGANTIGVYDSTAFIDFTGNGLTIDVDLEAPLTARLYNSSSGYLAVTLRKRLLDSADDLPEAPLAQILARDGSTIISRDSLIIIPRSI